MTRGIDGLRPYFTAYLPALILAATLTPATVAVIAFYDLPSTVIVAVTLPLIPIFMVLIGLAHRGTVGCGAERDDDAAVTILDLLAGLPTLRALGRGRRTGRADR